jgi:hypothetical protein
MSEAKVKFLTIIVSLGKAANLAFTLTHIVSVCVNSVLRSQVYIPHAEGGWARASVLQTLGKGKFQVRVDGIDDGGEPGEAAPGRQQHVKALKLQSRCSGQ